MSNTSKNPTPPGPPGRADAQPAASPDAQAQASAMGASTSAAGIKPPTAPAEGPPAPALHARHGRARGRDARARRGRRRGDRPRGGRGRFNARGPAHPALAADDRRARRGRQRAHDEYGHEHGGGAAAAGHASADAGRSFRGRGGRGRIERRHEDDRRRHRAPRRRRLRPPSAAKTPTKSTPKSGAQITLPPVTSVWLITLSGGNFAQALAQTAAAPYIDSQLVPAGTLLSGWSSLDGSAFASEAGLLSGVPPQTLDAIVQPPCPEGAAGTACAPETAGALTAADEFLKATLPAITASAAYREHGLVVITFGSVGNATASSLPAGSSTATLSSEPPVGVLLLSPFARAGALPTSTFNPTSPKQSLAALLH